MMMFNEEKLKDFAEKVRKQSDCYGLPTAPKKKKKNKKMYADNKK